MIYVILFTLTDFEACKAINVCDFNVDILIILPFDSSNFLWDTKLLNLGLMF